jgi:hypothetical protein
VLRRVQFSDLVFFCAVCAARRWFHSDLFWSLSLRPEARLLCSRLARQVAQGCISVGRPPEQRAPPTIPVSIKSPHQSKPVQFPFLCGSLQEDTGIALESTDQKTQEFAVQIAFPRWFLERVHQLFAEMHEDINCFSIRFLSSISHVVLLAPFCVSIAVHNPVLKVDCFAIAVRSWPS